MPTDKVAEFTVPDPILINEEKIRAIKTAKSASELLHKLLLDVTPKPDEKDAWGELAKLLAYKARNKGKNPPVK